MSPTHSNKRGVRYRYYISHALLQNRMTKAGSVPRVPAPEIEALVLDGVRKHLASTTELPTAVADRDLIERYVERVIIKPQAVVVCLTCLEPDHPNDASAQAETTDTDDAACGPPPTFTITLSWAAPSYIAIKGIIHASATTTAMKPESRDALLGAIAKARRWIEDLRLGHVDSFAEIAEHEALGERHIRLLAPLAFVSPRTIAAIVDGTAPAGLTVTGLAKALPYSWAEQERTIELFK
jgi:site-specific DNA recombinase